MTEWQVDTHRRHLVSEWQQVLPINNRRKGVQETQMWKVIDVIDVVVACRMVNWEHLWWNCYIASECVSYVTDKCVNCRAGVQGQRTALQDVLHLGVDKPRTTSILRRVEAEYETTFESDLILVNKSVSRPWRVESLAGHVMDAWQQRLTLV